MGVKEIFESINVSENREKFMSDAKVMTANELFEKWFPESLKVRVERIIGVSCIIMGIYSPMKK